MFTSILQPHGISKNEVSAASPLVLDSEAKLMQTATNEPTCIATV